MAVLFHSVIQEILWNSVNFWLGSEMSQVIILMLLLTHILVAGIWGSNPRVYIRSIQCLWRDPAVHSERGGWETEEGAATEGWHTTKMLPQALQPSAHWVTQHTSPSCWSHRAPTERTHLRLSVPYMCCDRLYPQLHKTGAGFCLQWSVPTQGAS